MAPRTRKPVTPVKKECKECRALPYLEPGTEPVEGQEYRPRIPRKLATDKAGKLVPGPRCTTHNRARTKAVSLKNHGARVEMVYGITADFYWKLYEFQGGKCYICQRATGASKRLAVDHNHDTGEVRGLLCKTCNADVIGHLRHDPAALRRGAEYLEDPPARRLQARLAS